MKVVILAGGFGTRISEESHLRPKPMIEIGGMPLLWHIMKWYSSCGFNEFIICAGYKQDCIKNWFSNYFINTSDVTFDYTNGKEEVIIHRRNIEPWKVTVVDTGCGTQTGGRILRIRDYIGEEPFMVTYGDGVGDIDIKKLLDFHKKSGKTGTISTYRFGQNKGVVQIGEDGTVETFREKSRNDSSLINIGFMVFEPGVFDCIKGDDTVLETGPLAYLAEKGDLSGYMHTGYWQYMDTLREKQELERLWKTGEAPWKC